MKTLLLLTLQGLSIICAAQERFIGTIVYQSFAEGEEKAAQLFNDTQAREIAVTWSEKGFEQREFGGWNEGKVFYQYNEDRAVFCDKKEKKAVMATIQNLGDTTPEVKKLMPHIFSYQIEPTGIFEIISDKKCQKYKIIKSGFMKAGATGFAWLTDEFQLNPCQLQFETEWERILALLPLQFAFKEGTVLKLEIVESSFTGEGTVKVTYQAKAIKPGYFPAGFLKNPYR